MTTNRERDAFTRVSAALEHQWQHEVIHSAELLSDVIAANAILEGDEEPAIERVLKNAFYFLSQPVLSAFFY